MLSNESGRGNSRIVQRKNIVRRYLVNRDIAALKDMAQKNPDILRTLSSLLYDREALVRWRAIEAMGKVSKIIFETEPEKIRRQIRRILWLMNDESGGLCRNGPEAIGEIIFNNPALIDEYGPILVSYLGEEPFEAGVRNALARLAVIAPSVFADSVPVIIKSLGSEDPYIRGFSVKALIALDDRSAVEKIETMTDDQDELDDYDFETGGLMRVKISELAFLYLKRPR